MGARDTMLDMTGLDPGAWPALCDNCLDAGGCFEGGAEKRHHHQLTVTILIPCVELGIYNNHVILVAKQLNDFILLFSSIDVI